MKGTTFYAIRRRSYDASLSVGTPLGSVGATILAGSKVLLLSALGFLLRYLDPRLAEVIYLDTDSIFVALCHPTLEENVSPTLRHDFLTELPQFVNTGAGELLSGYLLLEESASEAFIFGEKMYTLISNSGDCFKSRMKGFSYNTLQTLTLDQCKELQQSDAVWETHRCALKRVHAGPINMVTETKRFKLAIRPRKRKFVDGGHSFPWC